VAFYISRHAYDPASFGAYTGYQVGWTASDSAELSAPLTCLPGLLQEARTTTPTTKATAAAAAAAAVAAAAAASTATATVTTTTTATTNQSVVFFAGETQCSTLNGFTHGALQSGREVAAALLFERGLGPDPATVGDLSLCNWQLPNATTTATATRRKEQL
jgi:hypothetical protein